MTCSIHPVLWARAMRKSILPALVLAAASFGATAATDYPIAGTQPSKRPAGAPVITSVTHNEAWYRRALRGVEAPYPSSLQFLESQGNWYTPFSRMGMNNPYDLRRWHQQ